MKNIFNGHCRADIEGHFRYLCLSLSQQTSNTGTGSTQAALVTMVTALPASTANSTVCTSTTGTVSSQVIMSTGTGLHSA